MKKETITAKSNKSVVGTKEVILPENFDELVHKYTDQTHEQIFKTWRHQRVVEIQNSMRTLPKLSDKDKKIVSGVRAIKEGSTQEKMIEFILANPGLSEKEIIAKMREFEKALSNGQKK